MPRTVLLTYLQAPATQGGQPRWLAAWEIAMRRVLAEHVVAAINLATGSISADMTKVDDPVYRVALAGEPSTAERFTDEVIRIYGQELRVELRRTVGRRTEPAIRRYLEPALGQFQNTLAASGAISTPPRALWVEAADQLSAAAYAAAEAGAPEHRVLDALLLASYFRSCRLTSAADVRGALLPLESLRLFARGSFTRIVQRSTRHGVLDPDPPVPSGTLQAFVPSLTLGESLVPAVAAEAASIVGGAGVMRLFLPPGSAYAGFAPTPALVTIRDEIYRQYEFSTLGHLALAAVEQSLRALAEHHGVPHLKINGAPRGVMNWATQLPPLSAPTQALVAALYDSAAGGLRNRVAHGSLIDIDSKRYERVLFASGQASRITVGRDPYLPECVANVCIEALTAVDRDLGSAGLVSGDFRWMARLAPTAADLAFASSLRTGMDGPAPKDWMQQMTRFLTVFCPTVGRVFTIGLVHWMSHQLPTTHAELTYLVLTFEAVVRTVAQILRKPCLSASVVGTELRAQYLMLDEDGLNATQFIDDVASVILTPRGQARARRCMQIATTTRNACVHGALGAASPNDIRALSKSIVLAVDLLIARALHHMCEEAAYFVWERESKAGRAITPEAAWREGEQGVLAQLDADANAPRQIPASAVIL